MYDAKRMDEVLIPSSGKMVLLDKLLPKLKREGHKVCYDNHPFLSSFFLFHLLFLLSMLISLPFFFPSFHSIHPSFQSFSVSPFPNRSFSISPSFCFLFQFLGSYLFSDVKMIDLIEEFCDFRGYSCERLDGRVSGNDRQKVIVTDYPNGRLYDSSINSFSSFHSPKCCGKVFR